MYTHHSLDLPPEETPKSKGETTNVVEVPGGGQAATNDTDKNGEVDAVGDLCQPEMVGGSEEILSINQQPGEKQTSGNGVAETNEVVQEEG